MNNPFESIEERLKSIEELLTNIFYSSFPSSNPPKPDDLLTVEQAAQFLSLSVQTVYGLTSKRKLPFLKRSKRCYFLRDDLMGYLKQGRKMSTDEIAGQTENFICKKRGRPG